jgi:hypothetical protein
VVAESGSISPESQLRSFEEIVQKGDSRITHTKYKRLSAIARPDVVEPRCLPHSLQEDHRDPNGVGGRAGSVEEEEARVGIDFSFHESDVALAMIDEINRLPSSIS